ncbi:MAG: peptide chain release factor 1 [Clostridia bacterium]|nr:peptide chain release factor 1 [Clostridia bacterium]
MNTEKLNSIALKYEGLSKEIADPLVISDTKKWSKLCKEHTFLQPIVEKYREYLKVENNIKEAEDLLLGDDEEMKLLAEEEIVREKEHIKALEEELKILLLPKDPNDDKNVIIEIRGGTGGEEAALFAAELARMYKMYADKCRYKVEEISINATELGGVKEEIFMISGAGVYGKLKYESGVHRVQRVPETETQGRIHTSAATVAVLPEAEDVNVEILDKDLKIDTYRSGGAGGQHVNRTDSAVRMTHLPTGIVVCCEDERSQTMNKEKAMRVLKARVYDYYSSIAEKEYAQERKSQVGSGDRSERIRTYNFPQGRVTDHRIGLSLYSIGNFMNGDLDEMLGALRLADITAKLSEAND